MAKGAIRAVRARMTYANVAATLALMFAMSGGALAAKHYLINSTRQINPKVLKKLRGARGARGSIGPNGALGPQGVTGPEGPRGPRGEKGPTASRRSRRCRGTRRRAATSRCPCGQSKRARC